MKPEKIVYSDRVEWHLNGHLHREDGPALEYSNGDKYWWQNGELHRFAGPAVEYSNGCKAWRLNGKRHRIDGPAIEYNNGDKYWFLNNIQYTEQDYWREIAKLYPNQIHEKSTILTALL